jgi:hypothetical protein
MEGVPTGGSHGRVPWEMSLWDLSRVSSVFDGALGSKASTPRSHRPGGGGGGGGGGEF